MPFPFIPLIIGTAIAVGLATAVYFWDEIEKALTKWLRDNDLQESDLFSAFVKIDKVVRSFRVRLRVKKKRFSLPTKVIEYDLNEDNMNKIKDRDPKLYESLMKRGKARIDMDLT